MSFEESWGISLDRAAAALDEQLTIVDGGRVRCCIGLMAGFYFEDGHTNEVRERVAFVFELYRKAVGDVLVWGGDPKTGRPKKVRGTSVLDVRSWMGRVGPLGGFAPVFHGAEKNDDASAYLFSALARPRTHDHLSTVTFAVPLSWASSQPQGAYLSLVLQTARILRPRHGYAGLGVLASPAESGTSEDMAYAVPLVLRFRGLELDFACLHARYLEEGIKGVNWLTILEHSWVTKLGGRDALARGLGPDILIHDHDGGVVIQAGPCPRFGDVNRAEPMPHYERVARVLKPIRVTDLDALAPRHGLDGERTTEWLARFDT